MWKTGGRLGTVPGRGGTMAGVAPWRRNPFQWKPGHLFPLSGQALVAVTVGLPSAWLGHFREALDELVDLLYAGTGRGDRGVRTSVWSWMLWPLSLAWWSPGECRCCR
ncbi:hypothetical protein MRX96_044255 [Rhipicephalus microplus]